MRFIITLAFGISALGLARTPIVNQNLVSCRTVSLGAPTMSSHSVLVSKNVFSGKIKADLFKTQRRFVKKLGTYKNLSHKILKIMPPIDVYSNKDFNLSIQERRFGPFPYNGNASLKATVDGKSLVLKNLQCRKITTPIAKKALKVSIYGDGARFDAKAYKKVMGVVAKNIANLTISKYALIGRGFEGGSSFCLETASQVQARKLMQKLTAIKTKPGTTLQVSSTAKCK